MTQIYQNNNTKAFLKFLVITFHKNIKSRKDANWFFVLFCFVCLFVYFFEKADEAFSPFPVGVYIDQGSS